MAGDTLFGIGTGILHTLSFVITGGSCLIWPIVWPMAFIILATHAIFKADISRVGLLITASGQLFLWLLFLIPILRQSVSSPRDAARSILLYLMFLIPATILHLPGSEHRDRLLPAHFRVLPTILACIRMNIACSTDRDPDYWKTPLPLALPFLFLFSIPEQSPPRDRAFMHPGNRLDREADSLRPPP